MKQSSRHIPSAVTLKKQSFLKHGRRHTECACYFLNGIAFIGKKKKGQAQQWTKKKGQAQQ